MSGFHLKSAGFHVKSKDHLQGIVTLCFCHFCVLFSLADLEGRARCTSPQGSIFFCFDIHVQKLTASGVHAPYGKSWISHWFLCMWQLSLSFPRITPMPHGLHNTSMFPRYRIQQHSDFQPLATLGSTNATAPNSSGGYRM